MQDRSDIFSKNQAVNPILPSFEYMPDPEPHIFNDRVYLFGSHDQFNGEDYCINNYVSWSASIHDLSTWTFEGTIYKKTEDPLYLNNSENRLYAPDVAKGPDGRYYLYYAMSHANRISVAVSNDPAGSYTFYAYVQYNDGVFLGEKEKDDYQFDPAVLVDRDQIYLYTGFNIPFVRKIDGYKLSGVRVIELNEDMKTIKKKPRLLFNKHYQLLSHNQFFEAPSVRKIKGNYYFIYSTIQGHNLAYAISNQADRGFKFGGSIISNGNRNPRFGIFSKATNYDGNNHGSIIEINNKHYVFYHRHTNQHAYSRQTCAERITIQEDGSITQVRMTSIGLNNGPLLAKGYYSAHTACVLSSRIGAGRMLLTPKKLHPYFTQSMPDRDCCPDQYISNIRSGSYAGFKYFYGSNSTRLSIEVRGLAKGSVIVSVDRLKNKVATIPIIASEDWKNYPIAFKCPDGEFSLYLRFIGKGSIDLKSFSFN